MTHAPSTEEYRAAIYTHEGQEMALTVPEEAGLSDPELIERAVAEAHRADLIGDEWPRVPEDEFRARLSICTAWKGLRAWTFEELAGIERRGNE